MIAYKTKTRYFVQIELTARTITFYIILFYQLALPGNLWHLNSW